MICSLDNFIFKSGNVNIANIQRSHAYKYSSQQTIAGFDDWQSSGRYTQSITLSGKLIQKKQNALDYLLKIAGQKKDVTLAFDDGRAVTVIIIAVEQDQAKFIKSGQYLEQDFEVKLEVMHGSI